MREKIDKVYRRKNLLYLLIEKEERIKETVKDVRAKIERMEGTKRGLKEMGWDLGNDSRMEYIFTLLYCTVLYTPTEKIYSFPKTI